MLSVTGCECVLALLVGCPLVLGSVRCAEVGLPGYDCSCGNEREREGWGGERCAIIGVVSDSRDVVYDIDRNGKSRTKYIL